MKTKILLVSLIVLSLFAVVACKTTVDNNNNGTNNDENNGTANFCDVSECGPSLGMPNTLCSDGKTMAGPTGRCLKQNDNSCGWEIIKCPTTQIANPASKFCVDNGGTLDIRTANDGSQTGYCTIKGKECEEWSLFRGECANIHFCTAEEKAAEICTMEYMPVCGNDDVTYGNKCGACAAKVDYFVVGECSSGCRECPLLSQPSPDFCRNGTLVSGGKDKCGCNLPPRCNTNGTTCISLPECIQGTTSVDSGKVDSNNCKIFECTK